MEIGESVTPPKSGKHNSTCPFCAGSDPVLRGATTHKGSENDSSTLARKLKKVEAKPSYVLEEGLLGPFAVNVTPAAHHLIPGNQVMDGHGIEEYTSTKVNDNLLEDIGYDINGAGNGVWLPTYPDLFSDIPVSFEGQEHPGYDLSGYMWGPKNEQVRQGNAKVLPDEWKTWIVNLIQERWGQAHIGDHEATGYERACRDRLDQLTDLMIMFWEEVCEKKSNSDGKLIPPYGLAQRIDLQSEYMCNTIMPRKSPTKWTQWVSNYAKDYTERIKKAGRKRIT